MVQLNKAGEAAAMMPTRLSAEAAGASEHEQHEMQLDRIADYAADSSSLAQLNAKAEMAGASPVKGNGGLANSKTGQVFVDADFEQKLLQELKQKP